MTKHIWENLFNISYPKKPLKYHKFRGLFHYSKNIVYYTDYPFDGVNKKVSKIKVLSYDGDKYCQVLSLENNQEYTIKSGHIDITKLNFQR